MEFQLLVENGELTISELELSYLVESLDLTEDEVIDLISEGISDVEITEEDAENGYIDFYLEALKTGDKEVDKALRGIDKESMKIHKKQEFDKKTGAVKDAVKEKAGKAWQKVKDAPEFIKQYAQTHPGKTAAIAAGAIGATALGAHHVLKKRKAKKDEDAKKLEDVMIPLFFNEDGDIFMTNDDMDFLLEAFDYNLSEDEIMENILEAKAKDFDVQYSDVNDALNAISKEAPKVQKDVDYVKKVQKRKEKSSEFNDKMQQKAFDIKEKGKELVEKGKEGAGKVWQYAKEHPGKTAAIAAGVVGGATALGVGAHHVLKKRKAKKAEDAKKLEDVMIPLFFNEDGDVLILDEDLDFLLEAYDYELSEAEIMENILEATPKPTLNMDLFGGKSSTPKPVLNDTVKKIANSTPKPVLNDTVKNLAKPSTPPVTNINKALDAVKSDGEKRSSFEQNMRNLQSKRQATGNQNGVYNSGAKGEERAKFEQKMKDMTKNNKPDGAKKGFFDKAKEMGGKAADWAKQHPGKATAIGAAAVLGTAAAGYAANKALKKRKAKKNIQEGYSFRDAYIDVYVTEGAVFIDDIDMDFLLEACEYELTAEEIAESILAEAQDTMGHIPGQKVIITSSRELAKVEEKQLDDIPERVKDGKLGNEEVAASTANVGKKEIQESVEYDEYAETFEGDHLIMEAILEDAGIELSEAQMQALIEANLLSERSIVRLDKAAKRTQAEKKALVVIAREQGDPLYKKLVKVYKQKNEILDKLDSKYGTRAIARVRGNARKIDKED